MLILVICVQIDLIPGLSLVDLIHISAFCLLIFFQIGRWCYSGAVFDLILLIALRLTLRELESWSGA